MTILCAITNGTETWIGSDTLATRGAQLIYPVGPKWLQVGDWWLGVAGDWRATCLLRDHDWMASGDQSVLSLSAKCPSKIDTIDQLANTVRALLEEDGFTKRDGYGPKVYGQHFLVARAGQLWSLPSDFAYVEWPANDLLAEGSGEYFAFGAGYALGPDMADPCMRLTTALRAACYYDNGCGGALWLHHIEADASMTVPPDQFNSLGRAAD